MRTRIWTAFALCFILTVSSANAEKIESNRIRQIIETMKDSLEVDADMFADMIRRVEAYAIEDGQDSATSAMLHSMAAQMYATYYNRNRWEIDRRTAITDYLPDDVREWTANMFAGRIGDCLRRSLSLAAGLAQSPRDLFGDVISVSGELDGACDTFYDFALRRAIDIQPSDSLYLLWLDYRRSFGDLRLAMAVELDWLDYRFHKNALDSRAYGAALDSLLNLYRGEEVSVEIVSRIVDFYMMNMHRRGGNVDSLRTVAYELCRQTAERFPDYERTNLIRNRIAEMEHGYVQIQSKATAYPGRAHDVKIQYRNVSEIRVSVYRSRESVSEFTVGLPLRDRFNVHDTVVSLPPMTVGLYDCVITSADSDIKASFVVAVSRLASVIRPRKGGGQDVIAVDYLTGKPVAGARVHYYNVSSGGAVEQIGERATDRNGMAVIPKDINVRGYRVTMNGDTAALPTSLYNGYETDYRPRTTVDIFTDRGIYRPGQTVRFKCIAYSEGEHPTALAGRRFDVVLRDANYTEIATKSFVSGEYGSFDGEFALPSQAMTGHFSIQAGDETEVFRVEEYRRPSFKVDFDSFGADIAFGDSTTVGGWVKTFSDVALGGAEVRYSVVRRPLFRGYYFQVPAIVAGGVTATKGDGSFSFDFIPEKDVNNTGFSYNAYEITVTVTDSKGETQEERCSFYVGDSGLMLSANLPPSIDCDAYSAVVTAKNLNGEAVDVTGEYVVYLLSNEKKDGQYAELGVMASGVFRSGEVLGDSSKVFGDNILSRLPSGRVRLYLKAKDGKGREVVATEDVLLYRFDDRRPPINSPLWIKKKKDFYEDGEKVDILFGTSFRDAHLLYEVFDGERNVTRKWIALSDANVRTSFTFEPGSRGMYAVFTLVHNGGLHSGQLHIDRKEPDRTLKIKPSTFRDKLLPGSRERWTFNVIGADSVPVAVEAMAGMYDASLDRIQNYSWQFRPEPMQRRLEFIYSPSEGLNTRYASDAAKIERRPVQDFRSPNLDWMGVLDMNYMSRNMRFAAMAAAPMSKSAAYDTGGGSEMVNESMITANDYAGAATDVSDASTERPQIRSDFSETSFFFPAIRSNKDGIVEFEFSLPESNTTWKTMIVAHTPDMKYGNFTAEVVSQKKLMVVPNLPRFIRQNDSTVITAQVVNAGDRPIEGKVSLELFDPETEEVFGMSDRYRTFSVNAGETAVVEWTVCIEGNQSLTGCRIIASSIDGSDGEQRLLPILPAKISVVDATPFYIIKEGLKEFNIPSPAFEPIRTTVEITANPVWYAVQSLPALVGSVDENAVSRFAAFYSSAVADIISKSNPEIRKTVNIWDAQPQTNVSPLKKNEELKNIVLEETPFVMAATTETEQIQSLRNLFDRNRIDRMRIETVQWLQKSQLPGGGWGWFNGMSASRCITLYLLNGMAQLKSLGFEYNKEENEMLLRAIGWLDGQFEQDYNEMRKAGGTVDGYLPTVEQIEYLYVRSSFSEMLKPSPRTKAVEYYTIQATANWTKASLQQKARIALLMQGEGRGDVAANILAWFRKTATVKENTGMYWANNRRGNSFFISPIDVHSQIIAAFQAVDGKSEEIELMKQWLLAQKQTQTWESVPATVNALHSLLATGRDWTAEHNNIVLRWGELELDTKEGAPATKYIKSSVEGKPKGATDRITVEKSGKAPAWGAVYAQYLAPIDSIDSSGGDLRIEKMLFVDAGNGRMEQVSPERPLKVGDRATVRLVVRSARDMEYVSLKDLRPSCFEPARQLSGIRSNGRLVYYESTRDASENFFFEHLTAGVHVLEYACYVSRAGSYSGGLASLQCLYAPEFIARSGGGAVVVGE